MERMLVSLLVVGLVAVLCSQILADPIAGDVDNSTTVDAVDVQLVINTALGIDNEVAAHDLDFGGGVDAIDVQLEINVALGTEIDADHDGLADVYETHRGTDPLLFDTDGDTVGDGQEELVDHTDPLTPPNPPETFYQITFTANGSLWHIEPSEGRQPENISDKLDVIATEPGGSHFGPIKVSPDGSYYAFFS